MYATKKMYIYFIQATGTGPTYRNEGRQETEKHAGSADSFHTAATSARNNQTHSLLNFETPTYRLCHILCRLIMSYMLFDTKKMKKIFY